MTLFHMDYVLGRAIIMASRLLFRHKQATPTIENQLPKAFTINYVKQCFHRPISRYCTGNICLFIIVHKVYINLNKYNCIINYNILINVLHITSSDKYKPGYKSH